MRLRRMNIRKSNQIHFELNLIIDELFTFEDHFRKGEILDCPNADRG